MASFGSPFLLLSGYIGIFQYKIHILMIRTVFLFLIFFLFIESHYAQIDTTAFNSYLVLAQFNVINIYNADGLKVFSKEFRNPYNYLADIDNDQLDEMVIVDSINSDKGLAFVIYFYSGDEDFKLIDSIDSGSFFPFITYSEEIESMIIETGNPEFEQFNFLSDANSLPINLWKIDNDTLIQVNDELYDPYILENTNLLQLLDYYAHNKGFDCSTSQFYKGMAASAFANYINAGEQALAYSMLKKYYLCDDLEIFKQEIINLLFPKAK